MNNKSLNEIALKAESLNKIKAICKENDIKNIVEYNKRYKEISGLISHPERVFADEWESYKDLFDMPEFLSYEDMVKIIAPLKLKSQKAYKTFVLNSKNPQYPLDPQGVYSDNWQNWYVFLGKEQPFKVEYIHTDYSA